MTVPLQLLKQYHEAAYGKQDVGIKAFKGASFDQYVLLLRIRSPGITRRNAGLQSEQKAFQKLASEIPPEPRRSELLPNFLMFERKSSLNLKDIQMGAGTQNLVFSRIKAIDGLSGLHQLHNLENLSFTLCGSVLEEPLDVRISLKCLDISSCDDQSVNILLRSTFASSVILAHSGPEPLKLTPLKEHRELEHLAVFFTDQVHGLGAIKGLPLKCLQLTGILPGNELSVVLDALAETLVELELWCAAPFPPHFLPPMPALKRLSLYGYESYRSEWVEWALTNPLVACTFASVPSTKESSDLQLCEVYKNIDILVGRTAKKEVFEIAANLVEELPQALEMDNGDLEDQLKILARKEKKKIQWESEADTFVARTSDLQTCRWLIDSAYALQR